MGIQYNPMTGNFDLVGSSGGGGAVSSVNGQTGAVQLDAVDVPYDNTASGLSATEVQAAIDEINDNIAHGDVEAIYVDPTDGSDATGTGSILNPVASINYAVTLVSNPALKYVIRLAPGDYTGATVSWPVNADMIGSGNSSNVQQQISYIASPGDQMSCSFSNVSIGDIRFDFTGAGIALPTLFDGTFGVTRVDALGTGPWAIRVNDSTVGDSDLTGNNLFNNCLFVSTLALQPASQTTMAVCIVGIDVDLYEDAVLSLNGCTVPGTLTGNVVLLTPTIRSDAGSLTLATVVSCNVTLSDSATYVSYDNTISGLTADTVKDAIDELASSGSGANVTLSNLTAPTAINQDLISQKSIHFTDDNTQIANDPGMNLTVGTLAGAVDFQTTSGSAFIGRSSGGTVTFSDSATLAVGSIAITGNITANSGSSLIVGDVNGGSLSTVSAGTVAIGVANTGSTISAGGLGSVSIGRSTGGGRIVSNGVGSMALGDSRSTNGSSRISSVGNGSLAFGVLPNSATLCSILSGSDGSLTFGSHSTASTGTIRAGGVGSAAFGQITSSGMIGAPSPSTTGAGSLMFGNVLGSGSIATTSGGAGSLVFGYVNTSSNGTIRAIGSGTSSSGYVSGTGSVIESKAPGGKVWGSAINGGSIKTNYTSGNNDMGSTAFGVSSGSGGTILSNGDGVLSFGANAGSGSIESIGYGSLAFGYNDGSGLIKSEGSGSLAFGRNMGPSGSDIYSVGAGSIAGGLVDPGSTSMGIQAQGAGSVAIGHSGGSDYVLTTGTGSISVGRDLDNQTNYTALFGIGHVSTGSAQFLCGLYSNNVSNPRFAIGNGIFGSPSNCFEVASSGAYKTYGTHTRAVEVISTFPFTINTTVLNDIVIVVTSAPTDTVFLPLAPVVGQCYTVVNDYSSTDNLIIDGNGTNINGAAADLVGIADSMRFVFGNGQWQKI